MASLKIGGHTFNIILKDLGDGLAETDFNTATIAIHKDSPRTIKESSLIHEIFHVLNPTFDDTVDGHRLLDSLSEQFYQVLSDNQMIDGFSSVLGRE
jgi:hypothetical protein